MKKCTSKQFLPVLHYEVHDTDETQCHRVSHKTHAIYCFMWWWWWGKGVGGGGGGGDDKVSTSTHTQTHEED